MSVVIMLYQSSGCVEHTLQWLDKNSTFTVDDAVTDFVGLHHSVFARKTLTLCVS